MANLGQTNNTTEFNTGGEGGASEWGMEFFPNRFWQGGYIDHNICFGGMFTPNEELGDCFWEIEFEAKANNSLGVITDVGHGGNHPLLLEVTTNDGVCHLVGNIYNGTSVIDVTGGTAFGVGERHRAGYLVIGQILYIYLDGVLDGYVSFAGGGSGVRTVGSNGADGLLYFGASGEHQGFSGYIYGGWGFEEEAFDGYGVPFASAPSAYQPSRFFTNTFESVKPIFSVNITERSNVITDLSDGFRGAKHHGFRSVGTGSQNHSETMLPQWAVKPYELPEYSGTPMSIPEGVDFFDDFSSDNRTKFYNWSYENAGLGYPSIGYGRLPRLGDAWEGESGSSAYPSIGILQGLACGVELAGVYYARQTVGSPNMEIEFDTGVAKGAYIMTRYVDADNYLIAGITKEAGVLSIGWTKRKAGSTTFHTGGTITNANATSGTLTSNGTTTTLVMGGSTYSHTDADLDDGEYFGFGVAGEQRLKWIAVTAL